MKYYLNEDKIDWYLDDVFLCKTTARFSADEINMENFYAVVMCLDTDKDKIQCTLKSVVQEGDESIVADTVYTPSYSAVQGTNNWNLCEFCGTECNNLMQYPDESKWKSEYESSLYINMSNGDISPSKDVGVGFKFTAPVTGMIRLSGEIENLGKRVVPIKICKDTTDIWSTDAPVGYSVGYYRIVSVERVKKYTLKYVLTKNTQTILSHGHRQLNILTWHIRKRRGTVICSNMMVNILPLHIIKVQKSIVRVTIRHI